MLLKDGVRYFPYEYSSEQELEKIVIEHYRELFGADTLFFEPTLMNNSIGVSAKSDGLIVSLNQRQWCLLEVELAKHSLHKHIVPQITNFNIAVQQPETKAKIVETLVSSIRQDPDKLALVQKSKIQDISKAVKETIDNQPLIAIIMNEKTPALEPICKSLPFETLVTEFSTFTRENALNVHIHSFEPLWNGPTIPKALSNVLAAFELVYRRGKTYDEAVKIAAKRLKIGQNSLRAMCTRDLGLTSKQLREILVSAEKVKQLLIQKFPEYSAEIQKALP